MTRLTTIGLDLAKKVFQIHGVDAEGKAVVARKLRRVSSCYHVRRFST